MKKIVLYFFASLLLAGAALAQDYPPIDEIRDFLHGDENLWPTFEQCATEFAECALPAGQVSLRKKAYDDAERFFLQALELGNELGVLGMILLRTEQNNRIEVLAWSQLELMRQVDGDISKLQEQNLSWAFRAMLEARDRLSEVEFGQALTLAEQLNAEWLPVLLSEEQPDPVESACPTSQVVNQQAPNYPVNMLKSKKTGWSYGVIEVDHDGNVIDQLSLLSNHRSFARATERALRKWKYEALNKDAECGSRRFTTLMEFIIEVR